MFQKSDFLDRNEGLQSHYRDFESEGPSLIDPQHDEKQQRELLLLQSRADQDVEGIILNLHTKMKNLEGKYIGNLPVFDSLSRPRQLLQVRTPQ